jgi:succinate--hydroxymethylglutarate CoA-transferase
MSHAHLVAFALHAIDLHPDLSIPPAPSPSAYQSNFQTQGAQRRTNIHPQQPFPPSATAAAGLFSRSEANPKAPINFIRKIQPGAAGSAPSSPYTTSFQHSSNNGNGYSGAVPSLRTGPQLQTSQEASSGPPPRAESAPAGVLGAPDIVMGGTEFANDDSNILIDGNRITAPSTAVEGNEEDESRESTPATPPYPKAGSGLMAKLKSDEEDLEWLVDGEAEEGRGYSHVFVDESGGVEGVTGDLGVA